MNNYEKIHIYLRQTDSKKYKTEVSSSGRPSWFSYEKCFKSILETMNPDFCDLTVMFDGEIDGHFTENYSYMHGFETCVIDSDSEHEVSTEQYNGSFYSQIKTSEKIRNDAVEGKLGPVKAGTIKTEDCNTIIYIVENDYLHAPLWPEALLELYNSLHVPCYSTLYDHNDKYLFTRQDRNDHWGMYKDLVSQVLALGNSHWRTIPSATLAFAAPINLFLADYDVFHRGIADNTTFGILTGERKRTILSPIPGYCTHCQEPFLSPAVNWLEISEKFV